MGTHQNFPLEELSIEDLFNKESDIRYEIPIYQRNYAWENEEITALVNDVWDAYCQSKGTYFIGTLVTYDRGDGRYEVIDGQQRLTTLYLILKSLERDVSNKLTYRSRMRSNETIKNLYRQEIDNPDVGILRGFKVAQHAIKEIVDEDKRVEFTEFLLEQVHIIHYKVPRDVNLNHYFEVMNSRGEQLEKHEIVKSKLIALLDEDERNAFTEIWQACSEMNVYVQSIYSQAKAVFGSSLHDFSPSIMSFEDLPMIGGSDRPYTLEDFIRGVKADEQLQRKTKSVGQFQPIIDFPNFLLIVLKITLMSRENFDLEKFILDDKELLNAFDEAKPDRTFAKVFAFNLLKARYFLDNYVVHHSYEDDTQESNPWQLEVYQHEGNSYNTKNLSSDGRLQARLVQLLSMFEVSFTPRQRKNYLFYCLYHLFSDTDLNHYGCFLSSLADKYFFDVYANAGNLNNINTPIPGAFDGTVLKGRLFDLNIHCASLDFDHIYGNGQEASRGVPLFVFNYMDYLLWSMYVDELSGKKLKESDRERREFFKKLGCSDFGLIVFEQFYFSRTRRSLEHLFPQANVDEHITYSEINCFGNYAMIGSDINSSGSNWSPKTKIDHYLDASGKMNQVSVASLKLMIMMQKCKDNANDVSCPSGEEWVYKDIQEHQRYMVNILKGRLSRDDSSSL